MTLEGSSHHGDNAHHHVASEAHEMYEKYHFHRNESNVSGEPEESSFPQFHKVSKTGVIYASSRAREYGFDPSKVSEWANMGQGAPETGPLPNAPERKMSLEIPYDEVEYAPVTGNTDLREKIANYYNHLYREGKSQYTKDNICVVPGGRSGLTRAMAVLGQIQVGYFVPDYTAYEQCLSLFQRINPTQFVHRDINEACMPAEEFEFQTVGRGVGAVLMSNPSNPTGQSVEGELLRQYVEIARENGTVLMMDEFYSHYYYDGKDQDEAEEGAWPKTVSSARYVDNVNEDPVVIINGLTKNWRCPGFRVCWIVAPERVVRMLASAGSFLDGGANGPLQKLALPLMELEFIRKDAWALQTHFKAKRDYLLKELKRLGISVKWQPNATFYVWADLSRLPPPLNDCLVFFEECLREKVICVPGVFFDVNPCGLRNVRKSKCIHNVRFSYGPPQENLIKGVQGMEKVLAKWSSRRVDGEGEKRRGSTCNVETSSAADKLRFMREDPTMGASAMF
jgi:aspartate/methionine/tyrosine aminotransferase